jgi:hypothetical protein
MNRLLPTLALCTSSLFASAAALAEDYPEGMLAPVSVHGVDKLQRDACTPPSSDPACTALHQQLRREFSRREIGMLFGAATSYPEFLTSYVRVNARYQALLRDARAGDRERVALAAR